MVSEGRCDAGSEKYVRLLAPFAFTASGGTSHQRRMRLRDCLYCVVASLRLMLFLDLIRIWGVGAGWGERRAARQLTLESVRRRGTHRA